MPHWNSHDAGPVHMPCKSRFQQPQSHSGTFQCEEEQAEDVLFRHLETVRIF